MWKSIKEMPYQQVCWVRNKCMEKPVLATRGYAHDGMVHPDNTFCTSVFTPDEFFPARAGMLVCPNEWAPYEESIPEPPQ